MKIEPIKMNSNVSVITDDFIIITVIDKDKFDQINSPEDKSHYDPKTGDGFIQKCIYNGKTEVSFQYWCNME